MAELGDDNLDAEILRRWNDFREEYESLGFRRASYEYFGRWLPAVCPDLPSYEPDELKRRLHAYKKRLRNRS